MADEKLDDEKTRGWLAGEAARKTAAQARAYRRLAQKAAERKEAGDPDIKDAIARTGERGFLTGSF